MKFEGDQGWIDVGRSHFDARPRDVLKEKLGPEETRLYVSKNHMLNFLECMRTRREPICPVEAGHRSNSICVITHIAMKLGRGLRWDPKAERFLGDESANAMRDGERPA